MSEFDGDQGILSNVSPAKKKPDSDAGGRPATPPRCTQQAKHGQNVPQGPMLVESRLWETRCGDRCDRWAKRKSEHRIPLRLITLAPTHTSIGHRPGRPRSSSPMVLSERHLAGSSNAIDQR
ncbi:hypothetical protein CMEL01_13305 [Colletotrichum melonis]|uniref:Uncharacterized protein n=1 Tax=Colletotrichum melonis TaxID=1209925 RepID=A0AAI9UR80_9PEZI|nr:hypothetical protein CMEL01_13305 [Colletotrichum melonis]